VSLRGGGEDKAGGGKEFSFASGGKLRSFVRKKQRRRRKTGTRQTGKKELAEKHDREMPRYKRGRSAESYLKAVSDRNKVRRVIGKEGNAGA